MAIDPARLVLFIPALQTTFKRAFFERIAGGLLRQGGRIVRENLVELATVAADRLPIVGAAPYLAPMVEHWRQAGRQWVGWDRGYMRRAFNTALPTGAGGGYFRFSIGAYQMRRIRPVPPDRWRALRLELAAWRRGGRHVLVAAPSQTYALSHAGADTWLERTKRELERITDRPIVIRDKASTRPLRADLEGAHCLVAHGSIAAVEAVILGYPVIVHPDSAAALVGTELEALERPNYPDREPWVSSLAYSQFTEAEILDGTAWRLVE